MNQLAPVPAPAPAPAPLAGFYRRSASRLRLVILKRFESQGARVPVLATPPVQPGAPRTTSHLARITEEERGARGERRLPAFAPGCGGQEGDMQSPKGGRKTRTDRRVAGSRRWLATTSYKINALPQPLLRLQRPQRSVHRPHKLCLQESELELKLQPPMAPRNSTPFHAHAQRPTAIPWLFHDHLTTQNSTHMHTKRQAYIAGVDNSKLISSVSENEEPAPRFHNNNRQPLPLRPCAHMHTTRGPKRGRCEVS
jgi:hypothetical protein